MVEHWNVDPKVASSNLVIRLIAALSILYTNIKIIIIFECKVAKRPRYQRSIVARQYGDLWSDYAHISSQ